LVTMMDGSLDVKSVLNQGSSFAVTLCLDMTQ
jgi:signal transduction histidine kinase